MSGITGKLKSLTKICHYCDEPQYHLLITSNKLVQKFIKTSCFFNIWMKVQIKKDNWFEIVALNKYKDKYWFCLNRYSKHSKYFDTPLPPQKSLTLIYFKLEENSCFQ